MIFPNRYLLASYKNEVRAKSNYKNRTIEISSLCPDESIFYVDRKVRFKELNLLDNSIWQGILDDSNYPTGFKRKLR